MVRRATVWFKRAFSTREATEEFSQLFLQEKSAQLVIRGSGDSGSCRMEGGTGDMHVSSLSPSPHSQKASVLLGSSLVTVSS